MMVWQLELRSNPQLIRRILSRCITEVLYVQDIHIGGRELSFSLHFTLDKVTGKNSTPQCRPPRGRWDHKRGYTVRS